MTQPFQPHRQAAELLQGPEYDRPYDAQEGWAPSFRELPLPVSQPAGDPKLMAHALATGSAEGVLAAARQPQPLGSAPSNPTYNLLTGI